jgi:hypothetical protein
MELNILLSTSEYRGDHSADVLYAIDFDQLLSIQSLVEKYLKSDSDHIEIRRCRADSGKGE